MTSAAIWVVVFLALGLAFAFLARAAWRRRGGAARWLGGPGFSLLAVLFLLVAGLIGVGAYRLYSPRDYPVANVNVAVNPQTVARGEHIAAVVCADCHSASRELPLSGGDNLSNLVSLPLGDLYAPNLTPSGDLPHWSDGEVLRAIREGVHRTGRALAMPVLALRNLSDEDAHSLVAYLRSQPAVENRIPELNPSPLALVLLGAGIFDLQAQPLTEPVQAPPAGANAEYGAYVLNFVGCRDCHGPNLDGNPPPPSPAGPNLRPAAGWSEEQFATAVRTGTLPNGRQMSSVMPWRTYANLDDVEVTAIYRYLTTLR